MNEEVKDQDVLLVTEKDSGKLNVVTGMNEDGTPRTTSPRQENEPEFLRIDKQGNALENFMSNFIRQCKEPTHFHFFRAPLEKVESFVSVLQEMLKEPETPSNKEMLDTHRVVPEEFSKKPYQAIDESRIDWEQFEKLGIKKEMIDKKSLDKLLNWQKTPMLFPVKAEIGDSLIRTDARLSLRENPDGKLNLIVHALRKEPQLDGFVYGVRLTEDDKQNLRRTGHAGRLVEIEPVKGHKMPAFLSIDKMTNELVAIRADKIKIPNEIKGVTLNEQQRKELAEGKAVYLEGMKSKKGEDFSASVQINADRRGIEFKFDNANKLSKEQKEGRQQKQEGETRLRIPARLLGAELTPAQQTQLKAGQTIYVTGMTDRAGEPFNAYVKVNTEKEKLDFFRWNPDKAIRQGAEVTPDNNSKTQVAVNSEGKNNEATKDIKEPLKQGQGKPTQKQEEQKEEKQDEKQEQKVQKSKGIRM
ncbi:DUF3945 domain-containing protein [Prevotella sp. 10(H)]|uniref:DUF3945 domain-containing protein n=1 Tax=Prevotella sp. 10(H) TaxID=1158294 RepID=UPI0004A747C6|nr:DUF3945 domain-containing protein [Prevotella sp. 10(H)]